MLSLFICIVPLLKINPGHATEEVDIEELYAKPIKKDKKKKGETLDEMKATWPTYDEVSQTKILSFCVVFTNLFIDNFVRGKFSSPWFFYLRNGLSNLL